MLDQGYVRWVLARLAERVGRAEVGSTLVRPPEGAARVGLLHVRHAGGQKSSSNPTDPETPTWYADTLRSKKFDSSCTSCSSMKASGLTEP